jgi:hypothetical protein
MGGYEGQDLRRVILESETWAIKLSSAHLALI